MTQQHFFKCHYNWAELDPKVQRLRKKGYNLKQVAAMLNINYHGLYNHVYTSEKKAKSGGEQPVSEEKKEIVAETVAPARKVKKPTLKTTADELIALAQAIEVDLETGEVYGMVELEAANAAFEEKAEAVAVAIRLAEGFIETQQQFERDIAARRRAGEKKVKWLREYLKNNMETVGKDKIETVAAKIALKDTEAVEVTDEQLVPMEYKKIKWEVSKTAIRDAIKAGETVDGARMVIHRSVIIK